MKMSKRQINDILGPSIIKTMFIIITILFSIKKSDNFRHNYSVIRCKTFIINNSTSRQFGTVTFFNKISKIEINIKDFLNFILCPKSINVPTKWQNCPKYNYIQPSNKTTFITHHYWEWMNEHVLWRINIKNSFK